MKSVTLAEFKSDLSALLGRVAKGKSVLIPLLVIVSVITTVAEVEYQIHAKYICEIVGRDLTLEPTQRKIKNLGLPILITVSDDEGHPVSGAYAALKRIGPDGGYQKSDIMSPDSSRSDKYGNAVILHPNLPNSKAIKNSSSGSPDEGSPRCHLLGVVTVIAEGYETGVLELEQATKAAKISINSATVSRFTIVLRKKQPSTAR